MSNIFQDVRDRASTLVLLVFLISVIGAFISLGLQLEDIRSTGNGILWMEQVFQLDLVSLHPIIYGFLSLFPDVLQTLFFYLYMADTSRKYLLWASLSAMSVDLFFDVFERTNGQLFAGGLTADSIIRFAVALLFCFVAYTVGSNVAFSLSIGLIVETWKDAMDQVDTTWKPLFQRVLGAIFGGSSNRGQRQNTRQGNNSAQSNRGGSGPGRSGGPYAGPGGDPRVSVGPDSRP